MKTNCRFQQTLTILLLSVVIQSFLAQSARAESIHRELRQHIPQIVDYLRDNGYKTVGVLKFRVKKSGAKTTDSAGPINSLLADRLEVGLILANPFDEANQIQIIKNCSAQVADIPTANHLSADGRRAMFGAEYELAWGGSAAPADAFLTGVVQLHDDNQHVSVGILCFDKSGKQLERACDVIEAELDSATLSELGESFILRGAFDDGLSQLTGNQRQQQLLEVAKRVKSQQDPFPLGDPSTPLKLQVLYDGQPVEIETRSGQAFVPEPVEGQTVEFVLIRNPNARGRLGVLLKVNGENTLYRETNRDLDCAKWILSPEHTRTVVRGYQSRTGGTADAFTVLSRADSAARAIDYGRSLGQIQITVFQELQSAEPALDLLDEDEEDLLAMLRGVHPDEAPKNLNALKRQLRTATRNGPQTRGLIVQGEKTNNAISIVTFSPDPTPVMSATITYYSR